MRVNRVPDDVLFEKISDVFRSYGYEGASIRLLSEATGLERASLYHRFPGGKEEMASAIVTQAGEWFEQHVFSPLQGAGSPAERVRRAAANLKDFYRRGTLWCVLDAMTLGGGPESLRDAVRAAYSAWLDAFARIAREAGFSAAAAQARGQQALIEIEGSLVVARVTGDSKPFLRVVERLPRVLTAVKNE